MFPLFVSMLLVGAPGADQSYRNFSRVGHWQISKDKDGCAAALIDGEKALLVYPDAAKPTIAFSHPALNIDPGTYPVGLRIGPPFSYKGTARGTVMKGGRQMIFFAMPDKQSLERLISSNFIGFTLREREQFFNLDHGADAWRMLQICRKNARDPFQTR